MLNISSNPLSNKVDISAYRCSKKVFHKDHHKTFSRLLGAFFLILFAILFLPSRYYQGNFSRIEISFSVSKSACFSDFVGREWLSG